MLALVARHNYYKSYLHSRSDHSVDIPPLPEEAEVVDNGVLVAPVVVVAHKAMHRTFYTPDLLHC